MASGKELGFESEPEAEPAGTELKRLCLFFATGKLRSQRESHSPAIEANKIAAAFPPAIRHTSVVALLREACTSPARRRLQMPRYFGPDWESTFVSSAPGARSSPRRLSNGSM
jgi:hypothetical protein